MTEPFDPVSRAERIATLDVLRGFALFGVLLAYTFWSLGTAPEKTWTAVDRGLARIQEALVDGKFMTLFSFLFGLGFAIFLERASRRSADPVPIYRRRLLVLLLIGLTHALLLRDGDILAPYAILGFVLLLFRRLSDRAIAVAAFVCAFLPPIAGWVIARIGITLPLRPDETGLNWFQVRYAYVRYWYTVNPIAWPYNLALFLAGLWAGRRRLFEDLPGRARIFRLVLLGGLLVGSAAFAGREALLPRGTGATLTPVRRLGLELLLTAHWVGLAAFYAAAIVLLMRKPKWQRRAGWLAAVGRTALTNYLMQSVLIVPICFAFGLWDRVTPRLAVLLALVVGVVQVAASVWWLERFQFGPAEWLWRSLTYGRRQPMRIAGTSATVTRPVA
jgi:uncharacterized protein